MTEEKRSFPAELKLVRDGQRGEVRARVAAFGNKDLQGERIVFGAFADTIKQWQRSGRKLPISWAHQGFEDPRAIIGAADPSSMVENPQGLELTYQLSVGKSPEADAAYEAIKSGAVHEHSIGYGVVNSRTGNDGVRELTALDLHEAGPCLRAANPMTAVLAVKSATTRPVGDIHARNMMTRRIDALLGSSGSKSADEMSRRIDALMGVKSTSSDDTMRRAQLACAEAGIAPPVPPAVKSAPTRVGSGRMNPAVGVFGMPSIVDEPDTRRIVVGPRMTAEDLSESLAAAEERHAAAVEALAVAERDLDGIRDRVARFDAEQHADTPV